MVSRVERSALANWWWTVDRWLLAALGALDRPRPRPDARREPAGRRTPWPCRPSISSIGRSLFLIPAIAVLFADLLSLAAACAARGPDHFHRVDGADLRRAPLRP